jgi:ligand-binding sensor domain-containing protein
LANRKSAHKIGLAIWWLKYFYETWLQGSTTGILLSFCAKDPPHRQYVTVVQHFRKTQIVIKFTLTYLILILTLNFSCVQKKSTENELNKTELVESSKTNTLKFTSGIRAIYQDSKGNYWFGSLQEGVAVYNGKSFIYFNRNDGLSDNQIYNIQEDNKGVIWFNTQK